MSIADTRTVLVIEDEVQTRSVFLKCLEFEGFRAFGASNGSEGIALAQKWRPDLVVCDIMMPDMDGYSVLSVLRRLPPTAAIPLIFLTAKAAMSDLRKGMELGADDYLTKPCTIEQFLSAINARIKRHEQLQKLIPRSPTLSSKPTPANLTRRDDQPQVHPIFPECHQLKNVFSFIESHYREAINLKDVAQEVGYSPAYLTSLVQEKTGRTIKQWIIERRMVQARQLLKSTTDSIRHIAEISGYNDAGYFTRQFKQIHGVSPQIWRQNFVAKLTD